MPSSTTNSSMNNNDRKRRGVSLSNSKKIRRSEFINNSKNERQSRSSSISDSLTKLNHITQDYSLSTEINFNNRYSTLRQINDSYDKNNSDMKRDMNSNKREFGLNENASNKKQDEIKSNTILSYDSDEELDKTKQNSNKISSVVTSSIITSSDLTNSSTKLLKLVVPQSTNCSSSIKMLSNGDGLSSALRIPTKIQLTKTLSSSSLTQNENNSSRSTLSINQEQLNDQSSTIDMTEKQQAVVDYPPTPPPPIIDNSHKPDQNIKGIEQIDSSIPNEHQTMSKRYSLSLSDWSVPPTSELSPTSLTSSSPDDSLFELDLKINKISSSSIKRRYRSLSFSCPILPYCTDKTKPITPPYKSKSLSRISNSSNKKLRPMSPVIKYSSIERLKRRRKEHQIYEKKFKLKIKNEYEDIFIIKNILNEIIEQIESINDHKDKTLKTLLSTPISQTNKYSLESRSTITTLKESNHVNLHEAEYERNSVTTKDQERMIEVNHQETNLKYKTPLRRSKKSTHDENFPSSSTDLTDNSSINPYYTELKRQTSTPLSFHSIASSSTDDQSINSPHSVSKTHIFTDIVNELINGAKGLDRLSCSLINFTNSIHNFIRLTIEKQNEKIENLQHELEKKCSSQLNRANIFCTKKIQYFLNKHSIITINEYINEITLIVKYFYLYILSLNCRKQENEFELILNDLINGKLTFINELFYSSILTTIIEDFILTSTLENDYLSSQPIIINQIEYSLPFIRNIEYENELLCKNEIVNPFSDLNDLEDYLNCCEHISTTIPYYPIQQSSHPSMYYPNYPSSGQYYYPLTPSSDMTPYYYHPTYSNSQQSYTYNHPSAYYNPLTPYSTPYNEQFNYYYNQQTSYNSTNDIPVSNNNSLHQSYRRINSNIQKKYSNPPTDNQTSAVFDPSNVGSPQSKSTTPTNPIYPS